MTNWIQIRTDKDWSNAKSFKLGDQSEVGTASYNASEESWTLPASKRYYYLTERGGWADGFVPKQWKVSFDEPLTLRIGINQKVFPPGVVTGYGSFESSGISQPWPRHPFAGDLWYLYIDTENVETKITNIAFSFEDPVFPYEDDPGFDGSELTQIEESVRELTEPSYTVFNGVPYYCGIMNTPEPTYQDQYGPTGVYKKLVNNEWIAAEESEIYKNLTHSLYGSAIEGYVTDQDLDYYWHSTDVGRELFVISHGDQYKAIYTIDSTGIVSNWEGSYWPDDRYYYYPEGYPSEQESNFIGHTTILDSQNQFWMMYTYSVAPLYETELRVSRFFHLDDARDQHLSFGYPPFESCLIYKETGTEWIDYPAIVVDSQDVIHIIYMYRASVGSDAQYRHVYCKDNTWSAPQIAVASGAGSVPYLLVDSQDNVHLIHPSTRDRWVYNGSSWSLAETAIPSFSSSGSYYYSNFVMDPWDHIHQVITYNRLGAYSEYGEPGYSVLAKISNEKGYWTLTRLADMPNEYSTYGSKLICEDDGKLHCFFSLYADTPTTHYISGDVLTSQINNSSSSASVSSESSSSSEESKSSESSVSSESSESSESDSSESSSSSSIDSKSSSSESESSSSSSRSADSKSSSSISSISSEHSSISWGLPCSNWSGAFSNCYNYDAYGCHHTWPKYDTDSTDYNLLPGQGGAAAFNGTLGDMVWLSGAEGPLDFQGEQYVEVEVEVAKAAIGLRITGPDSQYSKGMTDFDLVASNTGDFTGEEVVLKRVRGITWSSPDQQFNYSIKNSTAYKFYRLIPWGTQDTAIQFQYCRFERLEIFECYDDSSSSSYSPSSESSLSESSFSPASESSESLEFIGVYQLCVNTNLSSSSSSISESSYSFEAPDITWP